MDGNSHVLKGELRFYCDTLDEHFTRSQIFEGIRQVRSEWNKMTNEKDLFFAAYKRYEPDAKEEKIRTAFDSSQQPGGHLPPEVARWFICELTPEQQDAVYWIWYDPPIDFAPPTCA